MAHEKKFVVKSRNLALFETIMDIEPSRYLNRGDTVRMLTDKEYYCGKHGDKCYYKVQTPWYEIGYVLSEGLEESK